MKNKILKNNFVLLTASIIEKLIFFLITIFIARKLGVVDYGKWGFALAFTSFFMIFTDLGLNTYSIREISKFKNRGTIYFENLINLKVFLIIFKFIFLNNFYKYNKKPLRYN